MIPTIETICEDLAAGKITVRQAIGWLHQHAEGGIQELRDAFACTALTGLLSNSYNDGQFKPLSLATADEMADIAYTQAEAMLKRREQHDGDNGRKE